MNPLVNQALGALGGPQTLNVLGQELSLQVAPSQLAFDPSGATAAMDMTVAIAGGEASPGFVYTANGDPTVDPSTGPSTGFQLGIADDLINELLAEAQAAGMLDLTVPATGGSFDAAQLHMVLPPAISADAGDGQLHIVLGDIQTTYTDHGAPVARVAISATVDLSVVSSGGSTVALQLAPPQIHVDVLDDLPNLTGLDASDLSHSSVAVLGTQVAAIAQLLAAVPLPEIAGVTVTDLSVGADRGYVMVRGAL
jgi:hypothetical protein